MTVFETVGPGSIPGRVTWHFNVPIMFSECAGGAGLAGGDWDTISSIINEELEGEDHTLVVFKPS